MRICGSRRAPQRTAICRNRPQTLGGSRSSASLIARHESIEVTHDELSGSRPPVLGRRAVRPPDPLEDWLVINRESRWGQSKEPTLTMVGPGFCRADLSAPDTVGTDDADVYALDTVGTDDADAAPRHRAPFVRPFRDTKADLDAAGRGLATPHQTDSLTRSTIKASFALRRRVKIDSSSLARAGSDGAMVTLVPVGCGAAVRCDRKTERVRNRLWRSIPRAARRLARGEMYALEVEFLTRRAEEIAGSLEN